VRHKDSYTRKTVRRMVSYKKTQGLSDEKFARVIGKTKNTVHRWQTGESKAPERLLALALAHLEFTYGLSWDSEGSKHVIVEL
jgi:DNA-binding transcriptional regulator YiaG